MRAKLYDNYNIKIAYMQDCDKELIELGNHIKNLRKNKDDNHRKKNTKYIR